ncbi:MAG: 6-pyruvoyl trahydropterin synthase family protein [Planctomycetota bacterium]|jgi:6-pyruvoyltetrahydropterin/6-carboxytetrahydropterin synthase
MHKLARVVRFSVNPFLDQDSVGFNSYASKPPGVGLSIFFELCIELTGDVEPATGFVVNVTDIDNVVREFVVPIFGRRIREDFRQGKHVGFPALSRLLKLSWGQLADKFGSARLSRLTLALNPFRKMAVEDEDCTMVYFSEKFEFAAMHRLWNDDFSRQKNLEVFGKCANPTGHGHNYVLEVTVKVPKGADSLQVGEFEKAVDNEFITLVDHKNLNADVPDLGHINPTIENIAVFAWGRLVGKFGVAGLHCVTVWETNKTYCSYYGQ